MGLRDRFPLLENFVARIGEKNGWSLSLKTMVPSSECERAHDRFVIDIAYMFPRGVFGMKRSRKKGSEPLNICSAPTNHARSLPIMRAAAAPHPTGATYLASPLDMGI